MKKIIDIPEDFCNYVEGLMYETNARKDVLAFMINQPSINKERFEEYHKEYLEFYSKYEIAKREIQEIYVNPEYKDTALNWNLNFKTSQLEIELRDE